MIDEHAKVLKAQCEFMGRMRKRGHLIVFADVMDEAQRWDVIRRAILTFHLEAERIGKSETYAQAFERIAGRPLQLEKAA